MSPQQVDVLVIGEALIDIVESETGAVEHVGGSPANVALGLGRRGVDVALLAQIGDDERGRAITQRLTESGARVLPESTTGRPTSTALARIAADGAAEYEFDIAWDAVPPVDLAPRLVHTGSIAAFLEPGASSVRDLLARTEAADVTFDPNIRPALVGAHDDAFAAFEAIARLSTVVKMSDEDAAWLYPGRSVDEVLDAVLALGPRLAAVTRGADGATLATAADRIAVPPVQVRAVDTIGAGDTFMASLVHSTLSLAGRTPDRAALERIGADAVRAAAITVSRAGADLPWANELG
ncbi:carbohydrate kinase [Microbacterium sp. MEC084]|uniref:carbohydrate kinase family protein n=1 Tax=Microbacterium sp. MEC084 TaxID=1963027 RepID=UPI00106FC1EE|nr:carbohydrate kinase [Microbacterium sp. MEC084]MCD1269734.1 carbohydrate kinase [Microbacterium sp. MEC084]